MLELDAPGVQELPVEVEVHPLVALAVQGVAHQGMVDVAHVHADLMRAPGVEVAFDQGVALIAAGGLKALEHLEGGDGLAGERVVRHRHLHAVARRAGDAGVDGPLVHDDLAVHERDVAAVEGAGPDEVLQLALRVIVLCGEHEARRIAVQPMHDPRTVLPLHGPQMLDAAVVDERVGERAVLVPVRRVAHQAALLGEDDQVIVLIAYVEGNRLGHDGARLPDLGQLDADAVALRHRLLF